MKQFLITVAGVFVGLAIFMIGVPFLLISAAAGALAPAPLPASRSVSVSIALPAATAATAFAFPAFADGHAKDIVDTAVGAGTFTTLVAAGAQTARNAMQSSLTATLGTLGATQVRFVYGLPFAVVFVSIAAFVAGERVPAPTAAYRAMASAWWC